MSHDRFERNGAEDADTPPPELREVHARLKRDGALWRTHLPSIEGIASRLSELIEKPAATVATQERTERPHLSPHAPAPLFLADGQTPATRGRMAWWTAAAVAAVVILMATVLHSVAGEQATRIPATPTATSATATATTTTSSTWETVAGLANQSALPILAPSDPRVAYETGAMVSGVSIPLRRTDNAGATWVTLPVPRSNGASLADLGVQVSPLDASTVFLEEGIVVPVYTPTSCEHLGASAQARWDSANGPSGACTVDYYSTDGGQHWSRVHLPSPGKLFDTAAYSWPLYRYDQNSPQAQGGRVYASLHLVAPAGNFGQFRIITSTDGGLTWQFADAPLAAQGQFVCQYRAAPMGATIFAVAISHGCISSTTAQVTLWRSDDAGAHWRQIGRLHDTASTIAAVTGGGGGGAPLIVYQLTDDATGRFTTLVSLDGGSTWRPTPTAGIPAGLALGGSVVMGTLGDGSLVAAFTDLVHSQPNAFLYVTAFLAWKPSDVSWHTVSRPTPLESSPGYVLLAPDHQSGQDAIWLPITSHVEGFNNAGSAPTYTIQRYQLG
jgi:BNR/Asp-box repeat